MEEVQGWWKMRFTFPGCSSGDELVEQVGKMLLGLEHLGRVRGRISPHHEKHPLVTSPGITLHQK